MGPGHIFERYSIKQDVYFERNFCDLNFELCKHMLFRRPRPGSPYVIQISAVDWVDAVPFGG